jgi:hypothetical protein
LVITALLELRLKQHCVDMCEASLTCTATPALADQPAALAGLMIDPQQLAGARGHAFLATAGEKLYRYWKIGQHWLVTLRSLLARPFDFQIVLGLGRL